jgi:hypothetical protein
MSVSVCLFPLAGTYSTLHKQPQHPRCHSKPFIRNNQACILDPISISRPQIIKFKTNNIHIHIHTHNTPARNTHKHKAKQTATKHILGAANRQQKGGKGRTEGGSGESSHQEALHFISFPVALCHCEKKKQKSSK